MDFQYSNSSNSKTVRLKLMFDEKIMFIKQEIKTRCNTPQKLGLMYAVVILAFLQLFNLIINFTSLLYIVYNLIRLFMTIFCIVSFYTLLHLTYGKEGDMNDNNHVYTTFLSCFLSEFLSQFLTLHSKNLAILNLTSIKIEISPARSFNASFLESAQHILFLGSFYTLFSFYSNRNLNRKSSIIVLSIICFTRFYGSLVFTEYLPQPICSYFTYVCALFGVFFSFYLNRTLNSSFHTIENEEYSRLSMLRSMFELDKIHGSSTSSKCKKNSEESNSSNGKNNTKSKRKLSKRRTSLPTIPAKSEKVRYFLKIKL
jgi:hypothetical protein